MKYKHKKLGWIAELQEDEMYSIFSKSGCEGRIPKDMLVNSDDWQLLPDWEITAFRDKDFIYKLRPDGMYSRADYPMSLEYMLSCANGLIPDIEIYSVKRSDGVEFKIGDKMELSGENRSTSEIKEITGFKIANGDNIYAEFLLPEMKNPNFRYGNWNISAIQHAKTPLFTTEDGVEIFDGDKYFYVNNKFELAGERSTTAEKERRDRLYELSYQTGGRFFSTREAAEDYIRWNKPKYSLKQIKEQTDIHCPLLEGHRIIDALEKL